MGANPLILNKNLETRNLNPMIKLPAPNEIIEPKEINPKFLMIYGIPKVGKTEIISLLTESYLVIEIDPHGAAYFRGTYIECKSLEQLNEIGEQIIAQNFPYKYIIIDTITKLAEWCEDYATQMYKASNLGKNFKGEAVVGELPEGGGYYWLRRAYAIWFNYIKTLAPRIIFLGHVKNAALAVKSGKGMMENIGISEVDSMDIDLTGKLKQITCSEMDAIGYLYRKTISYDKETKEDITELRINFKAGTSVLGAARPKHLRGKDMRFNWQEIYLPEN